MWLVGRSADDLATIKGHNVPIQLRMAMHGLSRVVPNLNLFVPSRRVLASGALGYLGSSLGYAVLYATLLVTLGVLVFRKRDLT